MPTIQIQANVSSINESIPEHIRFRFDELRQLQIMRELSLDEEAELYVLVNQIETFEAQRIGYLAQLAQLHNKSVRELMAEFNISLPEKQDIENLALRYLLAKVGDAVTIQVRKKDEYWQVNVFGAGLAQPLGTLAYSFAGELLVNQSTPPEIMRQAASSF